MSLSAKKHRRLSSREWQPATTSLFESELNLAGATTLRSVKNLMHYETREAQPGDAECIARLIVVLGYGLEPTKVSERLEAYRNESSRVFVALLETTVVGFLSIHAIPLFHQSAMLGRVTAMAIDPQHFRQGIGSSLLKAAEDFAVRKGCSRIEVTSGDHRVGDAHLFYVSQGYGSDCRRFLKHLQDTEQAVAPNRSLTPSQNPTSSVRGSED